MFSTTAGTSTHCAGTKAVGYFDESGATTSTVFLHVVLVFSFPRTGTWPTLSGSRGAVRITNSDATVMALTCLMGVIWQI